MDNVENASVCSWEAVEEQRGYSISGCGSSSGSTNVSGSVLWVPDHAVSQCTSCNTEFWLGRRKHHCRCVCLYIYIVVRSGDPTVVWRIINCFNVLFSLLVYVLWWLLYMLLPHSVVVSRRCGSFVECRDAPYTVLVGRYFAPTVPSSGRRCPMNGSINRLDCAVLVITV